ncbi:MAG: hypothetical protein A3B53_02310 [Candidatus Levybacteria bacterium RIFCSPLOWO2_01_FULL_42_15]|nr:MAG: hypothetical protein A3B53_02310 [Candidatus Levybacteria bacterium RIFCSPLOWO2_01_FULL_42_15]
MKKRIYLILTEENLFHPHYFLGLFQKLPDKEFKIIGVTVLKEIYKKGFPYYLLEQYHLWGTLGFISIAVLSFVRNLLDKIQIKNTYSVQSIARIFHVPYVKIDNVNSRKHLAYLRKLNIDIIISSSGQIFKKNLLELPQIACINRHTALLPKYGGVLPVFWAMFYNEKEFGVSIHFMTPKVDQGNVVYQEIIPLIKNNSLFKNYILGFDKSIGPTIKALKNITSNKIEIFARFHPNEKQYFSFPTLADIKKFKKNNKPFSLSDIYFYLFR